MTEKRFICYFDDILKKWCVQNTDSLDMHYVADEKMGEEFAHLLNLYQQGLDEVEKENWQLKDALNQRTEQCDKYYEENEQLKKGMIRAVNRYIKNVDCNPPSSAHTYIKIKGALLNIREDLRDLIGDLDG